MSARALSTLGLLTLASGLGAQTLPVPSLTPPAADTPPRPRLWAYAFGASMGGDSNIDFLAPDGPGGLALAPYGMLARQYRSPRTDLRAAASGRWLTYPGQGLDRSYADLDLDGHYRASPRTDWRGAASYGFGYSDRSRILLDQGASLPVVKMRTLAASLGVSSKRGRHTTLRLDGRVYRTEFDSPGLIDGQSLRATVGLETVHDRTMPALEYAVEQVRSAGGRSYLTHFGSVQWTRLLSARAALLLQGGASYTPEAARAGLEHEGSFFGGAALTRRSRRSSVVVFLRREVTPAFGLGSSRLEWRGGVEAAVPFGRAWELRFSGTHVAPDSAGVGGPAQVASDDVLTSLGRRLGRRLEVSGEARYRRRGAAGSFAALESVQAGLFVTVLSPGARVPSSALP